MNNINEYSDFLNDNMNDFEEQQFAETFATDQDFRSGFKKYLIITGSITNIINKTEPPSDSKDNFFRSIGLMKEETLLPEKSISSKSFYNGKLFTGIVSGLLSSAATFLMVMLLVYSRSNNKTDIADNVKSVKTDNYVLSNQSENLNSKPIIPIIESKVSNQNKIKSYSNNTNKAKKDKIEISEKVDFNNESTNIEKQNFEISQSKPIFTTNLNNSKYSSNKINKFSFEPVLNTIKPQNEAFFVNDSDKKVSFEIEVKELVNWNIPEETIAPSSINKFNNINLALFFKLNDNLAVGTDIRQETFFVKYQGRENNGRDYEYEQQPNFTTLSLAAKYNYDFDNNIGLRGQSAIGVNNFGIVSRIAAGISYNPYKNISFIFGVEYSTLFFVHQNLTFNTGKAGLFYGISYKL